MAGRALRSGGGLVVLLAALGCSDGGAARQEFLSQANATCTERREKIEAEASKVLAGGALPDPQQFGRLAQETIIPELTAQFRELRELEPPEDLAGRVRDYVSQGEQVVGRMKQDPSLITNPANFTDLNSKATQIGLSDACHVGPA